MKSQHKTTIIIRKAKENPENYVDNAKLLEQIIIHRAKVLDAQEKGLERPRIPEYIGKCFLDIATKLAHYKRFVAYGYRDEMVSDAIENCVMYFHNFDPKKGTKPFAYFTQVILFAFIRRINKEEKNRYVNYKLLERAVHSIDAGTFMGDDTSGMLHEPTLYDNVSHWIADFERRMREKKLDKKKRSKKKTTKRTPTNEKIENTQFERDLRLA